MMLSSHTPDQAILPVVIGVLGAKPDIFDHLNKIISEHSVSGHVQLLLATEEIVESGAILKCDGVIGILDGNLGLSAQTISLWNEIQDHNLPRIVLAINTVTGRADFDEAIALTELVLNEDIAIRYFPLEDDEVPKYIGLLDVLTHEILLPNENPTQADPEHINLTIDDHNELVELLVHSDLSESLFQAHLSGMPISLPKLKELWDISELVTILPIDQWVSDLQIQNWLTNRKSIWIPISGSKESGQEEVNDNVNEIGIPLGIGIAKGVARIWNYDKSTSLELVTQSNEIIELNGLGDGHLIFSDQIRVDDTLRPSGTNFLVTSPSS